MILHQKVVVDEIFYRSRFHRSLGISFDKKDYDEIIRLLITPLMNKQK